MASGTVRSRWAAFGAAVAVCLGAGGLSWVGATISSGSKAVFVPMTPCRLVDTRPTAPLGPASTTTFTVHGTNGACTVPAAATAISGNATVTDPTDDGFMTIAPRGGAGTSSNLNWLRGQSPTPNAFTVALSTDGRIDVYNDRGTVNVIIDINGYYEDHDHDDRYPTRAQTDAALAGKSSVTQTMTFSGWDLTFFDNFEKASVNGCVNNYQGSFGVLSLDLPIGSKLVNVEGVFLDSSSSGPYSAQLRKITTGLTGDSVSVLRTVNGGSLSTRTTTFDLTPPNETVDVNERFQVLLSDGVSTANDGFANGSLCYVQVTYQLSAAPVGPLDATTTAENVSTVPVCAVAEAACVTETP